MSWSEIVNAPEYVVLVLVFNVWLCEWLCRNTRLKVVSSSLLVIILTAIMANLKIVPSASNPSVVYDFIFQYIAPLSIFFLLLGVKLIDVKKAGVPMTIGFALGALGTLVGSLVSIWVFDGEELFGDKFYAIGGMMTGTYTGGSVNFNAIALHYDVVRDGAIFIGVVVADNILTALWMVVTISAPGLLRKYFPDRESKAENKELATLSETESIDPLSMAALIVLGLGTVLLSNYLQGLTTIPSVLILTTIALILAQTKVIQQLAGAQVLGLLSVYLFLAVVGAFCEIGALADVGDKAISIFGFTVLIIIIHGLVIFGVGRLFKLDWSLLSISSQANIGGASTALALSRSLKREDLLLPAILMGTVGAALGTYLGFFVAYVLQ
ncbi:MAG: DUF819 family protein [Cytophagales bacterium]|nr:DUF819 family protein [Cytophagales bacterium]